MEKRYQVFVSSTYADLKDERSRVIQTLMELDCIPAGMELFPAMDEEQFEFIKKVIDDCDYYVLIIGGRYGSTTADGISYTEKEYEHALSRGLKVLAFLHEKPGEIPLDKSEIDPELRARLDDFRDKVSKGRLVKLWTKAEELPGLVALSLSKTIKTYPATGWVRADKIANVDLLAELNELRKRNDEIEKTLEEYAAKHPIVEGLATLDEPITLAITTDNYGSATVNITFEEIYQLLAPELLQPLPENRVKGWLDYLLGKRSSFSLDQRPSLDRNDYNTIKIQFIALGLVEVNEWGQWSLTREGKKNLMQLCTIKTSK